MQPDVTLLNDSIWRFSFKYVFVNHDSALRHVCFLYSTRFSFTLRFFMCNYMIQICATFVYLTVHIPLLCHVCFSDSTWHSSVSHLFLWKYMSQLCVFVCLHSCLELEPPHGGSTIPTNHLEKNKNKTKNGHGCSRLMI